MTYRETSRKLVRVGGDEVPRRTAGSHRKWHHPATGRTTVLPDWGARDLPLGTIRAAERQCGSALSDFVNA